MVKKLDLDPTGRFYVKRVQAKDRSRVFEVKSFTSLRAALVYYTERIAAQRHAVPEKIRSTFVLRRKR